MHEAKQVPIKEQLENMSAQERIEFFRGQIPNYSTRVNTVIDTKFAKAKNIEPQAREKVLTAFQNRVEDFLASPAVEHGGSGLDHLSEAGLVSEDQYDDLYATAAALAAEIMNEAGFKEEANYAYASFGKVMAKKHLQSELS